MGCDLIPVKEFEAAKKQRERDEKARRLDLAKKIAAEIREEMINGRCRMKAWGHGNIRKDMPFVIKVLNVAWPNYVFHWDWASRGPLIWWHVKKGFFRNIVDKWTNRG